MLPFMKSLASLLFCLALVAFAASCSTTPAYDQNWTWDSPVFNEEAVLGQAGLLSSQQDTYFTSIWTLGRGALHRRQDHHLRTQHELWVRRQVELKKMSVQEAHARIRDYVPTQDR